MKLTVILGPDRLGQPMMSLVHCGGKYGCENGRSNAQRRYIEVIWVLTTSLKLIVDLDITQNYYILQ